MPEILQCQNILGSSFFKQVHSNCMMHICLVTVPAYEYGCEFNMISYNYFIIFIVLNVLSQERLIIIDIKLFKNKQNHQRNYV